MYPDRTQGRCKAVKIYLDSYIAAGFWMHFLCLELVAVIQYRRNRKAYGKRMLAGALMGAVADAVILIGLYRIFVNSMGIALLFVLTELVLVVLIAFGRRKLIGNTLLLMGATMFLSGFASAFPVQNIGLFCMAGSILLPLVNAGVKELFHNKQTEVSLRQSEISNGREQRRLTALMDTGNRLRLYGTGIPVVLVDEEYVKEWVEEAKITAPQKYVVLPYKGVGGRGLLQGVRVQCKIFGDDQKVLSGEVAAVAAEHRLFSGCEYQMLLQPEVLELPGQAKEL